MKRKLKPCPFCGSKDLDLSDGCMDRIEHHEESTGYEGEIVTCRLCLGAAPIAAWQDRITPVAKKI